MNQMARCGVFAWFPLVGPNCRGWLRAVRLGACLWMVLHVDELFGLQLVPVVKIANHGCFLRLPPLTSPDGLRDSLG
jgi:hypothetical protein